MPVSGPIVHQQLMHAYQEAQHELETARGHVAAAGVELGELAEDRGEAMVNLAQHYLPELTQDAIRKTWAEVQQAVFDVLKRKEQHSQRLAGSLEKLSANRLAAESHLKSSGISLDAATETQGEIANLVSQELSADKGFAELSDRAAQAEAALQRAEANLNEIEHDSNRKLPAYENSPLFMYLQKRSFLTPEYSHRGITRSMDQWLARYIGFREARQGYDFLKTTPKHMQELIAEDRTSLNTVLDELEQQRDSVAAKHGLPVAIQKTTDLTNERQATLAELEKVETDAKSLQSERTQIEDTRGPYYNEAITRFRDMLATADPRALASRAQATPEVEDDQIVAKLQGVAQEIDQLGTQVRQRQNLIEQSTNHLQAIGSLISRFRSAGFDSARAQFNGSDDVTEELSSARDGNGNYEDVWQRLRRSHRSAPSAVDQFTQIATHPMTQVLINAMAHAAAGALQARARQAGERRSSSGSNRGGGNAFGGGGGSRGGGGGSRGGGGFTNRDSF